MKNWKREKENGGVEFKNNENIGLAFKIQVKKGNRKKGVKIENWVFK